MKNEATKRYLKFVKIFRTRPVAFFEDILKYNLSDQQKEMVTEMAKPETRLAVKSSTGTGKTFSVSGMILHQLLTEPDIKMIATAPSAGQLKRGIKSEIIKQYRRLPPFLKDLIDPKNDVIVRKAQPDNHCAYVSADTDNKESLAGVHAKKVLIFSDEASALNDEAYDTLVGNLTTEGSGMVMISNPVRPDGKFRNLWIKKPKGWKLLTLDAFGSPFVSERWIEQVKEEYGEDSDFYRMRVLGEFPTMGENTFYDMERIDAAFATRISHNEIRAYPKVMGVDVARYGKDLTVILVRQGPAVIDVRTFGKLDGPEVAAKVIEAHRYHQVSQINIDATGVGVSPYDTLKSVPGLNVFPIEVGRSSPRPLEYANLRSDLHGRVKDWLSGHVSLPDIPGFREQLQSVRYGYSGKMAIQILSKRDHKKIYKVESPDLVDALSFTMYEEVVNYHLSRRVKRRKRRKKQTRKKFFI